MPGAFLLTAAPSGASWEDSLRAAPPALDAQGYVNNAWGECIHYACVFEVSSNWQGMPEYANNGPAGQVIDFAAEAGFAGFQPAIEKTEEASRQWIGQGNQGFCFQQAAPAGIPMGQPQAQVMGVPQAAPMGVAPAAAVAVAAPMQQTMQQATMQVQVPAGATPGTLIQTMTPSGQQIQVQVPEGVPPGGIFSVAVPGGGGGLQAVQDPWKMLATLPKIKIEEKMNMLETATGLLGELVGIDMELEMANKYVIRSPEGHPLFFAIDRTDFMNRQCGGDCRAIDVDVLVLGQDPELMKQAEGQYDWSMNPFGGNSVDLAGSQKFIRMHKDCQCTCCCLNRPKIEVFDGVTDQRIGTINDPCACCNMTFDMLDSKDQPALSATGQCCQLGLLCPCPFGPCKEVHFSVNDKYTQKEVGHLKKIVPDCMKFIVADDVDNYEIEFGEITDPQWKGMLIALGLFIDFRYFNTRSDKNDAAADSGFDFGGGDD